MCRYLPMRVQVSNASCSKARAYIFDLTANQTDLTMLQTDLMANLPDRPHDATDRLHYTAAERTNSTYG